MSAPDPIATAIAAALRPTIAEAVADALADAAPEPAETGLLTRAQLARKLGCSVRTVGRLQADGAPAVMVYDSPRFDFAEVVAWLRARKGAA